MPEPIFLNSKSQWPNAVLPYGESGSKTPVIMLHGLESHSAWFSRSATYIAGLGHPLYALERRGSGRSGAPRGICLDYQDLLTDIDSVTDQILARHNTKSFHLLGHCFGAIPAIAYACRFPARLSSLILATPAIYTVASPPNMDKLKILWAAMSGSDIRIPIYLKAEWFSDQQHYIDFIRNDELKLKRAGARLYWEVTRARRFIHANESKLQMPVFMAMAGRDRICDNRHNHEFSDRLPAREKELHMFESAVHILEFSDEREAFFKALASWFRKLETQTT